MPGTPALDSKGRIVIAGIGRMTCPPAEDGRPMIDF
jgi:hypothetical protein